MVESPRALLTVMKWLGLGRVRGVEGKGGWGAYFAIPPFEPMPSHQACPLPSMMAPGLEVMVMSVPPTLIRSMLPS